MVRAMTTGLQRVARPITLHEPWSGVPSAEERRRHEVTHLPFRSWRCACMVGKCRTIPRTQQDHGEESITTVSMDYCFLSRAEKGEGGSCPGTDPALGLASVGKRNIATRLFRTNPSTLEAPDRTLAAACIQTHEQERSLRGFSFAAYGARQAR